MERILSWIKRYIKRNRKDLIRSLIVLVSAIVVGFLVVVVAQLLEKPIQSYYPHDEVRGTNSIQWERVIQSAAPTLSDELFQY